MIVAGARPALAGGRYAAVLDAMRGDVFASVYTVTDAAIRTESPTTIVPRADLAAYAAVHSARLVGPNEEQIVLPHARGAVLLGSAIPWPDAADLATWEPDYGRLAEAQVRWEAAHGRSLTV
jgi:tRNA threonylcarbamoyladenosine biosynthesis protein TsaB